LNIDQHFGAILFWPGVADRNISQFINTIFSNNMIALGAYFFLRTFFNTKKNTPVLDHILLFAVVIFICTTLGNFFIRDYFSAGYFFSWFAIIVPLLLYIEILA